MNSSRLIVIDIPGKDSRDQEGSMKATRGRHLSANDLRNMLQKFPVEFIIVNAGDPVERIPVRKCHEFWKSEVKEHLVCVPDKPFRLEDYPGEYAYLAFECSAGARTPIVWLEKYH